MTLRVLFSAVSLLSLALAAAACSDDSGRSGGAVSEGSGGGSVGSGSSGSIGSGASGTIGSGSTGSGSGGDGTDEKCDSVIEVVYRDFTEAHPDFEWGPKHDFYGDQVRTALVEPTLSSDMKPIFKSATGCPNPPDCNWGDIKPEIESAATFDQWYRTVEGVNVEVQKTLPLTETPPGSGEYAFDSALVDSAGFFPLSPEEGLGPSPVSDRNSAGKNFLFTTEIHVKFGYTAGQKFTFRGDDDV